MIQEYFGSLLYALVTQTLVLLVRWVHQAWDLVAQYVHFSSDQAFASVALVFFICFASGFLLADVLLLCTSDDFGLET